MGATAPSGSQIGRVDLSVSSTMLSDRRHENVIRDKLRPPRPRRTTARREQRRISTCGSPACRRLRLTVLQKCQGFIKGSSFSHIFYVPLILKLFPAAKRQRSPQFIVNREQAKENKETNRERTNRESSRSRICKSNKIKNSVCAAKCICIICF